MGGSKKWSRNRSCEVPGCLNKHVANGYCRKHYMRLRSTGKLDLEDRLRGLDLIKSKISIHPITGCWIWNYGKDKDGYGKLCIDGKDIRAHRYAWESSHKQQLQSDQLACHTCDNPSCVNPDHIFIGSHLENHFDRGIKNRTAKGEQSGAAKLSAEDVVFIRTHKIGEKEAKSLFGISRTHYYRLRRGEAWEHLDA